MDPDAAWATVNDNNLAIRVRAEAAVALLDWVHVARGFLPSDKPGGFVTSRELSNRCLGVIELALEDSGD